MRSNKSVAFPLAIIALILSTAAAAQFPFALNHDAAWHFYTAFRVIEGARVGIDIADVNPPMSMWLLSLPALVSQATGLSPAFVLRSFVFALQLNALLCALSMLRRLAWPPGGLLTATGVLAAALLLAPGYHFAQREHIAVGLTLPYALLMALRSEERPVRRPFALMVGIAAAAGIGIKPYFLTIPVCLELWFCWRQRAVFAWLRPEVTAMVAVGALYLLAVIVYAPAYVTTIVPNAMLAYGGFDADILLLAWRIAGNLAIPACALGLALRHWGGRPLPATVQVLLTAGIGFLIAALLQWKGWQYQIMPAAIYWTAAAGLLLGAMGTRPKVAALMLATACLLPLAAHLTDGLSRRGTTARVDALARLFSSSDKATVFAFITSPRDIHPAVLQSGAHWADPFGAMIYLPAHLGELRRGANDKRSATMVALSESYNRDLLARLVKDPPLVIAFDASQEKLGIPVELGFDYIPFFQRYETFNRLMEEYAETTPIGRFRIFIRVGRQGA